MRLSDFDYSLPESLIAQVPIEPRDSSRLLVVKRNAGEILHRRFHDIVDFVRPGDLLVLNDTRVIPARLFGRRVDTGGVLEVLLLSRKSLDTWEVLVNPGRRAVSGREFVFGDGRLRAQVVEVLESGNRIMRFFFSGSFEAVLDEFGSMPLPPYIKRELDDPERYQTVYSREPGSAAAPTAGLHFTDELLLRLENMGVGTAYVTLHVGLGTFRPVKTDEIEQHQMHEEAFSVSNEAVAKINAARNDNRRVIAVGTTSVRILESVADSLGRARATKGFTNIYIYPGYRFKCVDAMITNFHLPKSSLIILVSAFAGRDLIMKAYRTAIEESYRFFSFGDAMLIL